MLTIVEDKVLDTRGLTCPMPILKTAREFKTLEEGHILKVLATDKGSLADFPAWAEDTGNELIAHEMDGDVLVFFLRKTAE